MIKNQLKNNNLCRWKTKMELIRSKYFVTIVLVIMIAIAGCKSPAVVSDTVDDDEVEESIFSARQDTVRVQTYREDIETTERDIAGLVEYYTVQIGAYKQPMNAERIYRKAQQRFNLETNTEYDLTEELYKITVGKFANYEQARAFRDRIMRDYPTEYIDAWIVEITQRQRRKLQ